MYNVTREANTPTTTTKKSQLSFVGKIAFAEVAKAK